MQALVSLRRLHFTFQKRYSWRKVLGVQSVSALRTVSTARGGDGILVRLTRPRPFRIGQVSKRYTTSLSRGES